MELETPAITSLFGKLFWYTHRPKKRKRENNKQIGLLVLMDFHRTEPIENYADEELPKIIINSSMGFIWGWIYQQQQK